MCVFYNFLALLFNVRRGNESEEKTQTHFQISALFPPSVVGSGEWGFWGLQLEMGNEEVGFGE